MLDRSAKISSYPAKAASFGLNLAGNQAGINWPLCSANRARLESQTGKLAEAFEKPPRLGTHPWGQYLSSCYLQICAFLLWTRWWHSTQSTTKFSALSSPKWLRG